jgi:hypothetical protein
MAALRLPTRTGSLVTPIAVFRCLLDVPGQPGGGVEVGGIGRLAQDGRSAGYLDGPADATGAAQPQHQDGMLARLGYAHLQGPRPCV